MEIANTGANRNIGSKKNFGNLVGCGANAILDTFIMFVLHNVGDSITLSLAWTNLHAVGCGRNSVDQLPAASMPPRPMAEAFYHKAEGAVQQPTARITARCARVR